VQTGKKLVALTYDDGPNPHFTPKFLDVLRRHNAKATFYVCGNMMKSNMEIARRIHAEGHELGNHTYSHPLLVKLSAEAVRDQLQRTNDLIRAANGNQPVRTMRPPYGGRNTTTDRVCRELGLRVILWDVDTNDWRKRTSSQIAETVLKNVKPGSIVLFHDRLQNSLDAQEEILRTLKQRGYAFVTVDQLLEAGASRD
jgi:peptidoglycan/xylan/chitin deacetylase (PgdA/CDA1 family)